mmetsp:Transcript_26615/g.47865  ORF Transcript_26615/g.47865 Transcript_26615/m.47865 type:complete len:386 (-) Transcript_26615:36-1193(-)
MELKTGIAAHVWLRNELAIATNSGKIKILNKTTYQLLHELTEHTQHVTSLDWNPITNFLISGSHDRSTLIWNFEETWKPALVNFPTTTAITEVCWSPNGQKFAATTAEGILGIGFYSPSLQLWNAKKIRAHKNAAILSVSYTDNGLYVVTGSVDKTIKVISAIIKEIDNVDEQASEVLYEFDAGFWVNKVLWAPDSSYVAVATHDARVLFWTPSSTQAVKYDGKPFFTGTFLSNSAIVMAGYDLVPILYTLRSGTTTWRQEDASALQVVKIVSAGGEEAKATQPSPSLPFKSPTPEVSRASSVRDTASMFEGRSSVRDTAKMFESKPSSAAAPVVSRSSSTVLAPKPESASGHRSFINSIQKTSETTFTTADITGVLVFWSVAGS